MKQRLISAAVAIILGIIVLFFYDTILLNIAIAVVALIAVFEVFIATRYIENRVLVATCFIFAMFVPFFRYFSFPALRSAYFFCFILVLFILLLANHKKMKLEQAGTVFMLTLLISVSFSCIINIRDMFSSAPYPEHLSLFYIILVFLGAWITDAGAYFIGYFWGKHKLAPEISPKKTLEGAAGGIVSTLVIFILSALIYQNLILFSGTVVYINYPFLIISSLICSFLAILGDLSASYIKRECKIKDFGNILPGHGGVLDRFDSILYVAPFLYIFLQLFPIIFR